ncbi:MAG: hypothetical protein GX802_02740 [Clostridiales bacterium]|jgi:hypothetical protein|nr:hypothetical protein [Clostridiales bacterium]
MLCFYGCTGVSAPIISPTSTNTPANTDEPTKAPATVQPTASASIVAIGKIEEEGFPTTSLELSVEGDYERLDAKLTARTGDASSNDLQEFVVEYEDIWEHFSNQSEFETFKVENGYLISVKKTIGHGAFEALIAAYFDGENLKNVEMPFNRSGYYGKDIELFELKWTGDTTFSLKSNLSGETKNYEVNIAHYESVEPNPFSEFDKAKNN